MDTPHETKTYPHLIETEHTAPPPTSAGGFEKLPSDAAFAHPRYTDLGFVGRGGFSEVRLVYDQKLRCRAAMKILRPSLARRTGQLQRFENEARICAGLSHPAIVSVWDLGTLSGSGRPFIVMSFVSGLTLAQTLARQGHAHESPDVLRRMVGYLLSVADAIAYAHSEGVVHRDLKPQNIMIGRFGEVLVLDWGIAFEKGAPIIEGDVVHISARGDTLTQTGQIRGTPAYMAPEQARGENKLLDERVDVFALGAILYELLVGHPPWSRRRRAADGGVIDFPADLRLPEALVSICTRALQPEPRARYDTAEQLAADLRDWLDRVDDIKRARGLVAKAEEADQHARRLRETAAQQQAAARRLLKGIRPSAPEEDKLAGWRVQDTAEQLLREARFKELERQQLLQTALSHADLPEIHDQLAQIYHAQHQAAVHAGEAFQSEHLEFLIRHHDQGRYADYLRREGRLTLCTSRPAMIALYRCVRGGRRRLEPQLLVPPQDAPIVERTLPIGSYLAHVSTDDGVAFWYPFEIARGEHTAGAMASGEVAPLWVPPAGCIPEGMIYVPEGPFWSGGDPEAPGKVLPLRRLRGAGFLIDRFPVTNAQYLAFLNDLVADGREDEALAWVPRERAAHHRGAMIYGRDAAGRFVLVPDADGTVWAPDWPVVMLTFAATQAYAAWRGARDGLPLRLPYELEWVQAARGADRRVHVWGTDAFDPTWCRVYLSTEGPGLPASVHDHGCDRSPVGVRGLAGNVCEICQDVFRPGGPPVDGGRWEPVEAPAGARSVRGGHWNAAPDKSRICRRGGVSEGNRSALTGFRLACSLETLRGR